MLGVERRWVHEVLGSFALEGGAGLAPKPGQVDYIAAYETLYRGSTPIARVGLRLALWLIVLSPLWLVRSLRVLPALETHVRTALLADLLEHPLFPVREAVFLLKLAACLALFADDELRAASGYDGRTQPHARLPLAGGTRD